MEKSHPPPNQDIFSSPLLPHTKHQRQSLQPSFSGSQHILHCGASLDAAHMLYGAGYACTIPSVPKPTRPLKNAVQLSTKHPQALGPRAGKHIYTCPSIAQFPSTEMTHVMFLQAKRTNSLTDTFRDPDFISCCSISATYEGCTKS